MTNTERLEANNAQLLEAIEMAETLPEAGGGGAIDALIDGSITEISSNAALIRDYAFYNSPFTKVKFPMAVNIGQYAFHLCTALEIADFPSTTSISDFAFSSCSNLNEINFPMVEYIGNTAFANCTGLGAVSLPSVTSAGNGVFRSCTGLNEVYMPNITQIPTAFLNACTDLKIADFGKASSVAASAFLGCGSLNALVLRYDGVVSLSNANAFTNCYWLSGTMHATYNPNGEQGYVYVPRSRVMQYYVSTNWTGLSFQYRALEDYTVDSTITGELDPNKI